MRRGLALVVAVLALAGCDSAVPGTSAPSGPPVWPIRGGEWRTSTPEAQGLSGRVLEEYAQAARSGAYGELHSLLVVRHGYLVSESYFAGQDENTLHPVYSVTKSVTSSLVGIALEQRRLASLGQRALGFFPGHLPTRHPSPEKDAITLEDLLTMRAGLEWDEGTYPYTDGRNSAVQLGTSTDWIGFVLDLPTSGVRGRDFRYNSGASLLLGGVLRSATGVATHDWARTVLFEPLEIRSHRWEVGPGGVTNTGWGLHLRPRDMARFGLLFLRNGDWDGRAVLSAEWVRSSTAPVVRLSDDWHYGYQWWRMPLSAQRPSGNDDIRVAQGWGGQLIFVAPTLDMVVVSTAGDYSRTRPGALRFIQELLRRSPA